MAASIGGKLSPLIVEIDVPPLHNALAEMLINVSAMAAEAEKRSRNAGDRIAAELEHLGRRLSLPVAISRTKVAAAALLGEFAHAARTHDCSLVVLDPNGQGHIELAEAVLFGSGGPVLVCPAEQPTGHLMSAAIAWDGSRASARAVRDALSVLKTARSVTILTMTDDKPIPVASIDGLREWLAGHGINANHLGRLREQRSIGDTLQDLALELGSGILVMGAYGHSRFREFVLGGATEAVLRRPRLPIFMSH
jgi:nucleotide-binding universal stress UspA family protein